MQFKLFMNIFIYIYVIYIYIVGTRSDQVKRLGEK